MFDRTETRRSRHSHAFSSQLFRVFLFLIFFISLPAHSQQIQPEYITDSTDEFPTGINTNQLPRIKNSPIDLAPFKPPQGETDWHEFFKNTHGSYSLSFMGPRIAGSGNETYNIYVQDVAPLQLSHYWQLGVQANPNLQVGFKGSAIQNIADGVVGNTGIVRGRTFEMYDPEIYANLPNLIKIPGMNIFTSLAMSLSLSDASKNKGKITQITLDQNWNLDNFPSAWSFGITTEVQPIFYTDPMPSGLLYRRTLFASIGHLIGYQISPLVSLQWTSTFDMDHRSPDTQGTFDFTSNLPDTSRFGLNINPVIGDLYLSMGGYFQFLVWSPSFETSILGANFSISF